MPVFESVRGDVRVRFPATHLVRPVGRQGRALAEEGTGPGEEETASGEEGTGSDPVLSPALVDALEGTGFSVVEAFEVVPAPVTPTDGRGNEPTSAAGSGTAPAASTRFATEPAVLDVDVEVGADHDAVVLVEQDGWYSWHPPTSERSGRFARRAAHTVPFEIPLTPADVPAAGTKARASAPRLGQGERSHLVEQVEVQRLLGPTMEGPVRVRVLDFPAPLLAGDPIAFLERGVDRGLLRLDRADPAGWSRADRLDEVLTPAGAPARVLLFVHGTFTNTVGTFGALALTPSGRAFLDRALRTYDAVVGFDHPTLSVDPLANATDLLTRVQSITRPVTVDIVCHSRGGLTARSFVEQVLPASGWNGRSGRIVFVGATNGGTILADPQRWVVLADVFTNLVAASARALAQVPGVGSVAAVVEGAVQGLEAFVRYLTAYAFSPGGVPGLAAMAPGGAFVTEINRTQPGQPPPGTPWYVVSSDFSVDLQGQHPFELPWQLALLLADQVLDEVFRGPNDLVVDVASMSAIDPIAGDYVADELPFGPADAVHHLGYVLQERFVAALHSWLLDPLEGSP